MGDDATLSQADRRRGIAVLARSFGFKPEVLRGRGYIGAHGSRRLALARSVAAWWLREHLPSTAAVARELALSTPATRSAIRRAVERYKPAELERYRRLAEDA